MTADVNVAGVERWASALGGAALAAYGVKQMREERVVAGAMIAAAGGALIARGGTGHCPMYAAAGFNTADGRQRHANGARRRTRRERGRGASRSIAPDEQLFAFWRNFEQLPTFMDHLVSVQQIDYRRSHWVAKAPAGRTVEWDAEIINEIPERADRLAHARRRRRRQRRLGALQAGRPAAAARRCACSCSTTRRPAKSAPPSRGCSAMSRRRRSAKTCAASSS